MIQNIRLNKGGIMNKKIFAKKVTTLLLVACFLLSVNSTAKNRLLTLKEFIEVLASCKNLSDIIVKTNNQPTMLTWQGSEGWDTSGLDVKQNEVVVTFGERVAVKKSKREEKSNKFYFYMLVTIKPNTEIVEIWLSPTKVYSGIRADCLRLKEQEIKEIFGEPSEIVRLQSGGDPESGDPPPYEPCIEKNGDQILYYYQIKGKWISMTFHLIDSSLGSINILKDKKKFKSCEELYKEFNKQHND